VNYFVVKRNALLENTFRFQDNYNWAIKWLDNVRDRIEEPRLPLKMERKQSPLETNSKTKVFIYNYGTKGQKIKTYENR
jgi:hypothetical protein